MSEAVGSRSGQAGSAVGDMEAERWVVIATLFGARISAGVAGRVSGVLSAAGLAPEQTVSHDRPA